MTLKHASSGCNKLNRMKNSTSNVNFPLNLVGPICTSTFRLELLVVFKNVHTRENDTSPTYILCMLIPQIISLPTLTLVYMWYEEFTPERLLGKGNYFTHLWALITTTTTTTSMVFRWSMPSTSFWAYLTIVVYIKFISMGFVAI